MASEFQKILDEIRKRSNKYKDIKDIENKIIYSLVGVYQTGKSLFISTLGEGGFNLGNLNTDEPLRVILYNFLSQCNGLSIDELYKIFRTLYKENKGITLLKEIRDELEKAKNPEINQNPETNQNPEINIPADTQLDTKSLDISSLKPLFSIDQRVLEEPKETTISEPNLDPKIYGTLEKYLANEQWKEADLETMEVLIKIADSIESANPRIKDRDTITWLDQEDIDKIPDEALKTIDQLWVKYSKGHFGFSVQAKIWVECRGKQGEFNFTIYQNKFAKSVGWYDGRNWLKRYDKFDFSRDAKRGHLPSLSFPNQEIREIQWSRWKETFERFFPRLFTLLN